MLRQIERFKMELVSRGIEIPPVVVRLLNTHRRIGRRVGVRRLARSVAYAQIELVPEGHPDEQLQRFMVILRKMRVTIPPIVAKLLSTRHQVPSRTAGSEALKWPASYRRVTRKDPSPRIKGSVDAPRNAEAGTEPTLGEGAFALGPRAKAVLKGIEIAREDLQKSGGSYTLEEVRQVLHGVSRQSVEKRVREGSLLAVQGPSNRRYYPVLQFKDDGSVVEGLSELQNALPTKNGYAILNFLVNADPRINNRKPIDLLKEGEIAIVVEAAQRVGEQGA
jgi:hypothetical protein